MYSVQIKMMDNWIIDGESDNLDAIIKIAEELAQFMPSRVMDEEAGLIVWDSRRV